MSDLEAYAEHVERQPEKKPVDLKQITSLVVRMLDLQEQATQLEEQAKKKREEVARYSTSLIPTALADAGMDSFTLGKGAGNWAGYHIGMEVQTHANVRKDNWPSVIEWLRRHKRDAIVKRELKIEFGRGEAKFAVRVLGYFKRWHGERKFTDREFVHAQTLGKFVREYLAAEQDEDEPLPPEKHLPRDLFGIYQETITVVEPPEKIERI
jgi:hypothetical protein